MHYRALGRTGVEVSEIGLGCNRLGEEDQPPAHWVELVQRAADLGVTLFDTAEAYQQGGSEKVLGEALGNRDDVLVATKVGGSVQPGAKDFSAVRVVAAAEESLGRLQRERIDIFQLHSPSRPDLERFDWAAGMEQLKKAGKVRFAAVAVNNVEDGLWLIGQGQVEVLQITYNLFDTRAEAELFDLAVQNGIGLMGRLPLAQGILSGKFHPGQAVAAGHRALRAGKRLAERIVQAEDLRVLGAGYEGGMARLAHHFSLGAPALAAIIPGARTLAQVEENAAAAGGRLSAETRAAIAAIRRGWGNA